MAVSIGAGRAWSGLEGNSSWKRGRVGAGGGSKGDGPIVGTGSGRDAGKNLNVGAGGGLNKDGSIRILTEGS